ncbi:hypothetical protein BN1708_007942 [Verticillium longisporum]|uniref:Zn(2)-C6 fungal-type domain-containing protein n=2 Tax=Verticillium longisporum TaxID=100787 RepID=A0A0G4MXQ6_VERLO|nr:hypothetical protein BN1708_007942 [Verticillium longisporum]
MPENNKLSALVRPPAPLPRPRPPRPLFKEIDPRAPPLPAPPLKKKRASRPKVRTGCLTCKIRRVKCDERKPTCARCHKADVECDGYFTKNETVASTTADPCHSSSEEASQPKGARQRHYHRPIRPRAGMPPSFLGVPLLEGLDVVYYDLFRHRLVPHLAGYRYKDLWSRIVLEAGMRDDCIRHCILAVGALTMAVAEVPASANDEPLRGGRPSVLAPWTHKQIVNEHHKHALRHHLKAVAGFRKSFQDPTTLSPRCVHLMTLILIVYEFMQGNNEGAKTLLNCGLALLRSSITLYEGSLEQSAPGHKEKEEDLDDIEHNLPCLAVMLDYSNQLARRDGQLYQLKCVPDDARLPQPGHDSMAKLMAYWGRFFTFSIVFISKATYVPRLDPRSTGTGPGARYRAAIRAKQKVFLAQLHRWTPVLREYARRLPALDVAARKELRVVRLYWLVLYVHFCCCHDPTDLAFDAFTAEFEEIVTETLELFSDDDKDGAGGNPSLTLGEGVASPLFFALRSCRDRAVRTRAAHAVGRIPWRDSGFDPQAMIVGKLGAVVMEEAARDANGFIPAEARWFWMGGEWHVGKRAVVATYVRHAPDELGRQVTKQLTLGVDDWGNICRLAGCCDEKKPECTQCLKYGVLCDSDTAVSAPAEPEPEPPTPEPEMELDMLDLELMFHWSTETCTTLTRNPTVNKFWQINVPKIGFRCDYVMRSMLSLAALHMAYVCPSREAELLERSVRHHEVATRSVAAVVTSVEQVSRAGDQQLADDLFLFSILTMFYAMSNSRDPGDVLLGTTSQGPDWILLFTGTRHLGGVSNSGHHPTSPLYPLIRVAIFRWTLTQKTYTHPYLDPLRARLAAATHIPANVRAVYDKAVHALHQSFGLFYVEKDEPLEGSIDLFIWVGNVIEDFLPMLREETPPQEALVIFSYFCMLPKKLPRQWWLNRWADSIKIRTYELLDAEHRTWVVEPTMIDGGG